MNNIAEIINAFSNLEITNQTIVFAIVIVIGVIVIKVIDDRKFKSYYNSMLKEKNDEIVRLADDNRRYRDIYLTKIGFKQDEVNTMTASELKR